MFGIAGVGWSLWWETLVKQIKVDDPEVAHKLEKVVEEHRKGGKTVDVPWRAFIRNPHVRALAYVHFCNNW